MTNLIHIFVLFFLVEQQTPRLLLLLSLPSLSSSSSCICVLFGLSHSKPVFFGVKQWPPFCFVMVVTAQHSIGCQIEANVMCKCALQQQYRKRRPFVAFNTRQISQDNFHHKMQIEKKKKIYANAKLYKIVVCRRCI